MKRSNFRKSLIIEFKHVFELSILSGFAKWLKWFNFLLWWLTLFLHHSSFFCHSSRIWVGQSGDSECPPWAPMRLGLQLSWSRRIRRLYLLEAKYRRALVYCWCTNQIPPTFVFRWICRFCNWSLLHTLRGDFATPW